MPDGLRARRRLGGHPRRRRRVATGDPRTVAEAATAWSMPGYGCRSKPGRAAARPRRTLFREPVVLPVGGQSVRPADGAVRLARQPRVARAVSRLPPQARTSACGWWYQIVTSGRTRRTSLPREPGLTLGPGPRARVLVDPSADRWGSTRSRSCDSDRPRPFWRVPSRVRPGSGCARSTDRARGSRPCLRRLRDVDAGALVPVDAADDEDLAGARKVAETMHEDRGRPCEYPEHAVPVPTVAAGFGAQREVRQRRRR